MTKSDVSRFVCAARSGACGLRSCVACGASVPRPPRLAIGTAPTMLVEESTSRLMLSSKDVEAHALASVSATSQRERIARGVAGVGIGAVS